MSDDAIPDWPGSIIEWHSTNGVVFLRVLVIQPGQYDHYHSRVLFSTRKLWTVGDHQLFYYTPGTRLTRVIQSELSRLIYE